MDIKFIYQI